MRPVKQTIEIVDYITHLPRIATDAPRDDKIMAIPFPSPFDDRENKQKMINSMNKNHKRNWIHQKGKRK
jgi:hypothetical protein